MQLFSKYRFWLARFPFEDDPTHLKFRPVMITKDADAKCKVEVAMVTSQEHYVGDDLDHKIMFSREAGLDRDSVVRFGRRVIMDQGKLYKYLGEAMPQDIYYFQTKFHV